LGVSGKAAAANIRPIIAKLQEIGATVRIFRVSVNELQHALDTTLRRSPSDRTGATADAIRRNEVAEAYVRQVANDPDTALAEQKIGIVDRKLNQFPNEHEHFTKDHYEDLFGRMTWHLEMPRREHDTTVITHIMRMRAGNQSRDLFQTKHVLITRNGALAQLGRRFCIDHEITSRNSVGPAIHQRQLATAVWLRTGLTDGEDVPRRYLLAACERVLELKKNVVDQVRLAARNLTKEKAEQLELLLTQDRSVQVLMDKTLGISNVVSAANIDSLVDVMRQGLTAEIERRASEKITAAERDAAAKVRRAHEARRAAEREASTLGNSLSTIDAEDRRIVGRLIDDVNVLVRRRRQTLKWGSGLLIFLVGTLPLLIESVSGWVKVAGLAITGCVGAILAFFQVLDRPVGLDQGVERWAYRKLNLLATDRGIMPKLDRYRIGYVTDHFEILSQQASDRLDL
jgi:hypothetical protein